MRIEGHSIQFIVEVKNNEGSLWRFDDKPAENIIDSELSCAFVSWCQDVEHRAAKPVFAGLTPDWAITLEWCKHGEKNRRKVVEIIEMSKE